MANTFILRGIDFELGFKEYLKNVNNHEVSLRLNHRTRRLSESDFSYRIINHWENKDLLINPRDDGKGWRKYSFMDMVWVHVLKELRRFGYSLEAIAAVKEKLSEKEDHPHAIFPLLEYYVCLGLLNKPVYLLVFDNGEAHPVNEWEYQLTREFNSIQNHIQININEILQKILPKQDLKPVFKDKALPSQEERISILMIRLEYFRKIEIMHEDGDITVLANTAPLQAENLDEVIRLILSGDYLKIHLDISGNKNFAFKKRIVA